MREIVKQIFRRIKPKKNAYPKSNLISKDTPTKLRALVAYFDRVDDKRANWVERNVERNTEVQDDLRKWAREIENALTEDQN